MRRLFTVCFILCSLSTSLMAADKPNAQLLMWQVPQTKSGLIPDISLIGSFAGAYFRDDPGENEERGEMPSRTGFNLQSVELAIQSVIDPYVRGDVFLAFKEEGVELEEAFITTLSLPANLQLRAGKFLAKLGRQNTQHLEQLNFVDTAFTNRYFFGAEGVSELGVEVSTLFPTPWFSEFSVEALQGENDPNFNGERKGDFLYLGHWKNAVDVSNDTTVQLGTTAAFGWNDTGDGHGTQIYGSDLYLRWRPNDRRGIKWQTEYFLRRFENETDRAFDGGIYSQLVGQFAKRWEAGLRAERVGFPDNGTQLWALSPEIAFLPSEFFRLRAQYNLIANDEARDGHEAFLQFQFNMGPHGAHAF